MTTDESYEQKRLELQQRQHAELLEEGGDYKRHHDYIERLKGRDPGRGTELLKVLTVVRHQGVCLTSDVAIARALSVATVVAKLKHLQERSLVARQQRLQGMGVGNYESTWSPERTATWPKK